MKIPFKLTDTGLVIGDPNITLQYSRGTEATLLDRGFDFLIQDDPTFKFGNYIFTNRSTRPMRLRLSINLPCMRVYNKSGVSIAPSRGVGTDSTTNDIASGCTNNFIDVVRLFQNGSNDHVYIGKPRGSDMPCVLLTNTGLGGVPNSVKESGQSANHLIRLTLKGPLTRQNNIRVSPGTTGPINAVGNLIGVVDGPPIIHSMGFHSGGIRTICKTNNIQNDGPTYASALIASHKTAGSSANINDRQWFEVPQHISEWNWKEAVFYCSTNSMVGSYYISAGGQITETEAGFFFEGSSRDVAITPIITNADGSLNLVAMDNKLNSTNFIASKLISEIRVPNNNKPIDPNPDNPLPSIQGLDSLFVKI